MQPKKRWRYSPIHHEAIEALQLQLRVHPVFCQLLTQRGITTYEQAERFFRPKWEMLHAPELMLNMDKAVERLHRAISNNERILVYGDYDVDGTTATALMYSFLSTLTENVAYYIPDRHKEGYGISLQGIEFAHSNDCMLVVALDCGITAHTAIDKANAYGINVIVCDHHLPPDTLPAAYAILNPKQVDCTYPYKELSGCALGFKLAQGYARQHQISDEQIKPLLDLVAVSLACDFVPLTDENRVLAALGLKQLNEAPRPGLAAMRQVLRRGSNYSIHDIVFGIGPMINAAGRLEHANAAVELLLAPDEATGIAAAEMLLSLNQERRDIESQITDEAKQLITNDLTFGEYASTVIYQPHWHKGVIGIVASRLIETYHRPTIVFTLSEEGKAVGSARSVGNFDIHAAIASCSDCLLGFGGHSHAAGLSIAPERIDEFRQRFDAYVRQNIAPSDAKPTVNIDAEIDLKIVDAKFWNILKQFAPFGPDNMRPVFLSKMVRDTGYSKLMGNNEPRHIKLFVRQGDSEAFEGVAFGMAEYFEPLHARRPFHLCYVIEENEYMGQTKMQLNVKDMMFS